MRSVSHEMVALFALADLSDKELVDGVTVRVVRSTPFNSTVQIFDRSTVSTDDDTPRLLSHEVLCYYKLRCVWFPWFYRCRLNPKFSDLKGFVLVSIPKDAVVVVGKLLHQMEVMLAPDTHDEL